MYVTVELGVLDSSLLSLSNITMVIVFCTPTSYSEFNVSVQITSPSMPDFEETRIVSRTESTSFQLPDTLCPSGAYGSLSSNDIVHTIVVQADGCVSVNAEGVRNGL